jgi:hypothetical protein
LISKRFFTANGTPGHRPQAVAPRPLALIDGLGLCTRAAGDDIGEGIELRIKALDAPRAQASVTASALRSPFATARAISEALVQSIAGLKP